MSKRRTDGLDMPQASILAELTNAEAARFMVILQRPESVSGGQKAMRDYIDKIRAERRKKNAREDPMAVCSNTETNQGVEDKDMDPKKKVREEEENTEKTKEQYNEERLSALIEEGKKRGKLSSKDLLDVLEDMNLEQEQIDRFYDTLENFNIDTTDGEDAAFIPVDEITPDIEELQKSRTSTRTSSSTRRRWWTAFPSTTRSGCISRKSARSTCCLLTMKSTWP